ncbi:Vacuolar protein sorting-associated protein 17 [Entomophthora muscae]|uniref:Vacuolar protein sorting-associated protein 17 n=1 Tax=Entomophthora muscae TaxID=34485 RepID=A0ACC2RL06_9FUNG|nr:Vacuolar protein sorting-associated protein 17 [Entomophthora muscae]
MPHFEVLPPSNMDQAPATLPVDIDSGMEAIDLTDKEILSTKDSPFLKVTVVSHDYSKAASYRLSVETNLNQYKDQNLSDKDRTYSEFVTLHSFLQKNHPDVFVPVLPPLLVNDIVDPTKDNYDFRQNPLVDGPSFTDPVRHDIQIFLDRVTAHPILLKDTELQQFLTTSFKYVGSTQKSQTPSPIYPPVSDDRLNGKTRMKCMSFVTRIQELIMIYCNYNKEKRALASRLTALGAKLQALSTNEDNTHLLASLRRASAAIRTDSLALRHGADIDGSVMTLRYIEFIGRQAQLTQSRIGYTSWVDSELTQAKKKVDTTRHSLVILKAAPVLRQERVSAALEDFEEAKKQESFREGQSNRLTERMPGEMKRFEENCNLDARVNFIRHARYQLALERYMLRPYKDALAEAKNLRAKLVTQSPPQSDSSGKAPSMIGATKESPIKPYIAAALLSQNN